MALLDHILGAVFGSGSSSKTGPSSKAAPLSNTMSMPPAGSPDESGYAPDAMPGGAAGGALGQTVPGMQTGQQSPPNPGMGRQQKIQQILKVLFGGQPMQSGLPVGMPQQAQPQQGNGVAEVLRQIMGGGR